MNLNNHAGFEDFFTVIPAAFGGNLAAFVAMPTTRHNHERHWIPAKNRGDDGTWFMDRDKTVRN
jgi:hypothetical protein